MASSISLSGYTRPLKARAWRPRIRFQQVAESTGKEVPAEEIVKGYEVEENQYVILADEELREVGPEKSTGIEIQEFVTETEISSLNFKNRITSNPTRMRARLLLFYEKRY